MRGSLIVAVLLVSAWFAFLPTATAKHIPFCVDEPDYPGAPGYEGWFCVYNHDCILYHGWEDEAHGSGEICYVPGVEDQLDVDGKVAAGLLA